MFPHKVTVFNVVKNNGTVNYYRQLVDNVFYQKELKTSKEGHGDKQDYFYSVIFSNIALKKYVEIDEYNSLADKVNNFTLKKNDIVVLGEYPQINDLIDLQKSSCEFFLIGNISNNRYGDELLQYIEVSS